MADPAAEWLIYITGAGAVQGELLSVFLEKETGLPCRNVTGPGLLPARLVPERRSIILSDCRGQTGNQISSQLKFRDPGGEDQVFIVLFNVSSRLNIEEELLHLGVWGVFYEEDPPETLSRGVTAVRNGEIWLSRQVMSNCLVNFRRRKVEDIPKDRYRISAREREVLLMIAEGYSNDVIADKLCVSVHTIRSHVYRIFKKIGVSNRREASIWADRSLH